MIRLIITSIIVLLIGQTIAQKALTLDQAILDQRSKLAPEKLKQLQWVPGSENYSFVKENHLIIKKWNAENAHEKIEWSKIQSAFGDELKETSAWPSIKWLSSDQFYFKIKATLYFYKTSDNEHSKISIPNSEQVAHLDMHKPTKNIAYTRGNNLFCFNGSKEMVISSEENENIVSGQAVHRFEFGISKGTFWSAKGNFLAFYRNDQSDVTSYPLVDINSTPATLKSTKYPMAGAKSEKVMLGIFDVKTGKTVFLKTSPEEDTYLTNISWSPDEKFIYVAVLNREQNHMKLNKYNIVSGDLVNTLFEETDEKYVEPLHPLHFLNDNSNQFIWWSQRDGYMHLYLYDDKGKLVRQLTKGEWVIKKMLGHNKDGKYVYVEGTGSKPTETYIYRVNVSKGSFKIIDETPGTHSGKLNAENNLIIDQFSSTTTPGITWVYDGLGKNQKTLLKSADPLESYKVSDPELMKISVRDERDLYARIIKPVDFDESKKYPVLVYVYNGPHAQMVRNQWLGGAPLWMYVMAERGYIIFTVDGRGSANRGIKFEQEIFRRIGDVELEDQLTGVEYLKSLPYADAERMAIHGWSYGGFMTISMMLRHPDVFKVGVAGGPVVDWKYYEVMYTERYMDTPQTNPEGFDKSNLLNYVTNLKGKLLTIHGLVDDVVVPQHNFQFLKKCVDEGVQIDFFAYPGHPHNVRGKDRIHLMTKVLDYIDEGLKE